MLPAEIWKHIALLYTEDGHSSSKVYARLVLTSRKFAMDIPTLQEYYLRKNVIDYSGGYYAIEYRLPNNKLHSPAYGELPAVTQIRGRPYHGIQRGSNYDYELLPETLKEYDQFWYANGKLHRNGNMPAVIYACGDEYWYVNGVSVHRDDLDEGWAR